MTGPFLPAAAEFGGRGALPLLFLEKIRYNNI